MKRFFSCKALALALIIALISACSTPKQFAAQELKENSAAAQINAQLSLSYLALGDTERAKQKILLALQEAPHEPIVWYTQGYLLEKTGNPILAEKSYLKAIALADQNGAAHNNYGAFLCRQGRYTQAIKQFLLAIQDPAYLHMANAYENAGVCALKIPDTDLAKKFFQQALKENAGFNVSS